MVRGARANQRCRTLENAVNDLLVEEYEQVTPSRFFALRSLRQPIFSEQCPIGRDIYGKNRRVDFILYHPQRWIDCLVIQCKWQASPGSVEEKYPFEVLSIQLNEFETILVLDGGGYSKEATMWLKGQAGKNKLRHVFSLGELSRFRSQGQLYIPGSPSIECPYLFTTATVWAILTLCSAYLFKVFKTVFWSRKTLCELDKVDPDLTSQSVKPTHISQFQDRQVYNFPLLASCDD